MFSYSQRIWILNIIIYEIGFVLHSHRSSSFAYQHSGHAECNRLYNGAVVFIIWFFNCILIMNFDNKQAAVSQKYVVCVRVKRRCNSHTGIQIEARRSKLSSFCKVKKTTFCCRFPFRELWIVSQTETQLFFFFRFVNLSII